MTFTVPRGALALPLAVGLLLPALALAQTPAATPPPFNPTYGAPIAGVCVFSQTQAIGRSLAGASAGGQLERLATATQTELAPQRNALVDQSKALAAEKAKLSASEYARRTADLQQRAAAFDRLANTRNAQLRQTRSTALGQIGAALAPVLAASVTSHRCGLVLDKASTYGSNAAMDLTDGVTQQLNAKLPSVTVTLAPPDAVAGKPGA